MKKLKNLGLNLTPSQKLIFYAIWQIKKGSRDEREGERESKLMNLFLRSNVKMIKYYCSWGCIRE